MQLRVKTKLYPNESTNPTLKAQGPRRTVRDPRSPVHGPAPHHQFFGQVTPGSWPLALVPLSVPKQGTCVLLVDC